MDITRVFVPQGTDPFSLFEYEQHRCIIKHHVTGKIQRDYVALVPKHWSTNARTTLIDKYIRKAGVPTITVESGRAIEKTMPDWLRSRTPGQLSTFSGETSVKQTIHRIVGNWTYVGYTNGYFDPAGKVKKGSAYEDAKAANAKAFYDEVVYSILNQMAAPNSPQWFNTGLNWAYGITGAAQGHTYIDLPHQTHLNDSSGYQHHAMLVKSPYEGAKSYLANHLKKSADAYSRVQAHACFILTVNDTMFKDSGIFDWYNSEGLIFKYGSGAGANLSNIRATNEKLSGGGKSSGLMSWMKVADYSAGAIKSGGTTRRAAKMVSLDLDHPDIRDFINCKTASEVSACSLVVGSGAIHSCLQAIMDAVGDTGGIGSSIDEILKEPQVMEAMQNAADVMIPHNYIIKAVALASQNVLDWPGKPFSTEYEGEAYQIVPFQNANHSVRIPKEFYDAVDRREDWSTTWRTTKEVAWTISAAALEQEIATATWFSGDPGVQYDTNINDWNVTPADGRIRGSNPCSEHMRPDDSACNLASLRIMKFFNADGFSVDKFVHAVHLWQIILDITVTMAHLPTPEIAMNVFSFRDTGLGYADLGAMLMAHGLAYDSDEGRALAAATTALLHAEALLTSAELAASLGAYPRFHFNREDHLRCVRNHMAAAGISLADNGEPLKYERLAISPPRLSWKALSAALGSQVNYDAFSEMICGNFIEAYNLAQVTGLRNAEATLLAPTGTISILMDCDTTGVEPMLGLLVKKTLAGGGEMVMEPAFALKVGLQRLGYDADKCIEKIKVDMGAWSADAVKLHVKPEHVSIADTSFPDPVTHRCIPWEAHVKMMAAVQPFLSGAISKTVNMPANATIKDVQQAYRTSHDLGLKAVAIYRDGCKLSQPLNIPALTKVANSLQPTAPAVEVVERMSPETPPSGRVLLGWNRNPGIDIKVGIGGGSLYLRTVRYPDGRCAEIWATFSADQGIIMALIGSACKTANIALQWGVPLQNIISSWQDTVFEPKGFVAGHPYVKTTTSLMNLIARLLDYHELGNTGGMNIQPSAGLNSEDTTAVEAEIHNNPSAYDKVRVTGETCPTCGSQQYVVSGAGCKKCLECGEAGGCG